jgi:CheY-like chemotaxis protein
MPPGYLSTLEAARICDVSVFSIQRWFDEGLLTGATLPGGRRRIGKASLDAFIRKHAITPAPAGPTARRILLVDDDTGTLATMRAALAAVGGCEVREATSGLEAGLALAAFRPQGVVVNLGLEGVGGAILVKRIRESQAGHPVRIVVLAGAAEAADDAALKLSGAHAVVRKPVNGKELVKALRLGAAGQA